ncbi:uncharacterized protein EV422DRAFT_245224 [Fimicolochytrium jonesii]|uniref:uncharacterized protein n=1 Tax=Fimicolochytrium jonesii TaxID=1396493 RepID=UPI0022FF0C5F|nr:uncharacterized protein EV422DRAFT_245224 [Fimicolochytrium jonesii]KAI8825097.1 hypothetical protein EV422DRAFT_245224 [Fimicolochytrium jonesii]
MQNETIINDPSYSPTAEALGGIELPRHDVLVTAIGNVNELLQIHNADMTTETDAVQELLDDGDIMINIGPFLQRTEFDTRERESNMKSIEKTLSTIRGHYDRFCDVYAAGDTTETMLEEVEKVFPQTKRRSHLHYRLSTFAHNCNESILKELELQPELTPAEILEWTKRVNEAQRCLWNLIKKPDGTEHPENCLLTSCPYHHEDDNELVPRVAAYFEIKLDEALSRLLTAGMVSNNNNTSSLKSASTSLIPIPTKRSTTKFDDRHSPRSSISSTKSVIPLAVRNSKTQHERNPFALHSQRSSISFINSQIPVPVRKSKATQEADPSAPRSQRSSISSATSSIPIPVRMRRATIERETDISTSTSLRSSFSSTTNTSSSYRKHQGRKSSLDNRPPFQWVSSRSSLCGASSLDRGSMQHSTWCRMPSTTPKRTSFSSTSIPSPTRNDQPRESSVDSRPPFLWVSSRSNLCGPSSFDRGSMQHFTWGNEPSITRKRAYSFSSSASIPSDASLPALPIATVQFNGNAYVADPRDALDVAVGILVNQHDSPVVMYRHADEDGCYVIGDAAKRVILCRLTNKTVMVRVGGGWEVQVALCLHLCF